MKNKKILDIFDDDGKFRKDKFVDEMISMNAQRKINEGFDPSKNALKDAGVSFIKMIVYIALFVGVLVILGNIF